MSRAFEFGCRFHALWYNRATRDRVTFSGIVLDRYFAGRRVILEPVQYIRLDPLRADLVGIQEMVSHSGFLGRVFVPSMIILFLALSPLLDRSGSPEGFGLHGPGGC